MVPEFLSQTKEDEPNPVASRGSSPTAFFQLLQDPPHSLSCRGQPGGWALLTHLEYLGLTRKCRAHFVLSLAAARAVGWHQQLVLAIEQVLSGQSHRFLRVLWHLKADLWPQSSCCKDLGSMPGPELYADSAATPSVGSVQWLFLVI